MTFGRTWNNFGWSLSVDFDDLTHAKYHGTRNYSPYISPREKHNVSLPNPYYNITSAHNLSKSHHLIYREHANLSPCRHHLRSATDGQSL
jgi:hypothetical protein